MIKEIKGDENFCNLYMFYQLFQKNLLQAIKDGSFFTPRMQLKCILEISKGINFLHNHYYKPIAHGNLKPENILLDECDNIFLTDISCEPI